MANTLQLKNDIKKLKGALSSKGLSASIKDKLKNQLSKAENELKSAQAGAPPRKVSTTKSTKDALDSLKQLIKKKGYGVYQNAGVDLKKDAQEGALATGRRVSKGLKGNQYGDKASSKGHVYYEYRANRLDVKQPKGKQKYPKLEKGGYMAKGGETNADRERMYNFLKDDLLVLKKSIEENNQEEIDKFFSYWNYHLNSLEPKMGSKRMYNFLKDDLVGLEAATKELPSSKEETDRFFSYWNTHLKSLSDEDLMNMMAKGGKLSKKDFFNKYEENEDENMHSENVVLLAENYGTESDIRDAKTILAKHESIGHLPTSLRQERDALHDKLYAKYLQSREDGGYMAEGGEISQKMSQEIISYLDSYINKYDSLSNYIRPIKLVFVESFGEGDDLIMVEHNLKSEFEYQIERAKDNKSAVNDNAKDILKIYSKVMVMLDGYMAKGGEIVVKSPRFPYTEGYFKNIKEANEFILRQSKYRNVNGWNIEEVKKSSNKHKMAKGGKLIGKQKNLDVNENGKLDAEDFKMLRKQRMAEGGITEQEVVDSNAQMVLSKIKEVHHHADELGDIVTKNSDIEAWVVAKIERASTDLSDITHYLDGQHEKMSMGGSVYHHVHKMDKK